jgi:hypothetical protein
MLKETPFRDISMSGCSFYSETAPDYTHLVAALGSPENLSYFTARVVHVQEFRSNESKRFIVGCQLIGKVQL